VGLNPVVSIRLKFLCADRDRHGNRRFYVRRPGQPKVRIRCEPGTEEFMVAYLAALAGPEIGLARWRPAPAGSFGTICQGYFASAAFKGLDPSTKAWRRRVLDTLCREHAEKPISRLETRHVRQFRDEHADKPAVANKVLKALRALFAWAVEENVAPHDPTREVKPIRYISPGFHSWSGEEIAQFESRHPLGTKAYLALALLLYTAGRREDVVRLGRQHIRAGRVRYTQAKNEHRSRVEIDIPLHPNLAAALETALALHLTFLVTEHGKPFTPAGFGNRFRAWCDEAGLRHCSAHGLRKATAARLAECGATEHEIMAITGHRTLKEVERYTQAARRAGLADSGMSKLKM
jgi:integrase/recombinase XerD